MVVRGRPEVAADIAAVIDAVESWLPHHERFKTAELRHCLHRPLRVALVGRVSAGKSTLLNALVGQRVAPTNETECTKVATLYRFGAPARVDVVGLDRHVRTLPFHSRLPDEFGRPAAEIDFVVAHIPSMLLRDYELVDTPGLATMNSTSSTATRRALVAPVARDGIERPEVTLYLCDSTLRVDEVAFLDEMGASRIDTMLLLSHADTFGEGAFGAVDPFEMAQRHVQRLKEQLARLAGAVLPVSALLAETALTGHLTEADAHALGQLADLDEIEISAMFGGEQLPGATGIDIDRLLELVAEYGILHGRSVAKRGAAWLVDWLSERSGIVGVRDQILRRFLRRSDVLKARRILTALREQAMESPRRSQISAILEDARMRPALHALREISALESMMAWDPTHPLVQRLDDLSVAATRAERLGLPEDTDEAMLSVAAREACVQCRRERLAALSAAEREAWTVLERSYQLLVRPR
jgi:hypothetical protein